MDLYSTSSEDTSSSFSYSPPSAYKQTRKKNFDYSFKVNNFKGNSIPHVDSLEKLWQLSSRKDSRMTGQYDSPKRYSDDSENQKITMKVTAQKIKMSYRPVIKPEMSPPQQTVPKKLVSILKKPFPIENGEKIKDVTIESKPSFEKPGPGMKEVVEIEVFMPVVDSENNKIIYPQSNEPIVKRYFVKKDLVFETRINSKSHQPSQGSQKNICPTSNVDAKPTESTSETVHDKRMKNTESSANVNECIPRKYPEKYNDVFEQSDKILHYDAKNNNETISEQIGKVNDVEIVLSEEKLNKKYLDTNKEGDEQSNHGNNKYPSQPSCIISGKQTKNKKYEENEESADDSSLDSDRTDGRKEIELKLVCTNKEWNRNIITEDKSLAIRSVSLDLSSINKRSKQNGWRKILPLKSLSSSSISNCWRRSGRNKERNELPMDSWIERNKYMQMKSQYMESYRNGKYKWRIE